MIDVVVLNYNDYNTTSEFVDEMITNQSINHILVVDNNSTDNSYIKLKKRENERVHVIKTDHNGGYGYGNNYGVKTCVQLYKSKYVLICNPDTIIKNDSIEAMHQCLECNKEACVVTCVMTDADKKDSGVSAWRIPSFSEIIMHNLIWPEKVLSKGYKYYNTNTYNKKVLEVDCVQGSLYMVNARKFLKIGGFDEGVFLYNEENILGIRNRKNHNKVFLLTGFVYIHHHSVSIDKTFTTYYSKWKQSWSSQKYMLKKYYHANYIMVTIAYVSMLIRLIQVYIKKYLMK